MAPPLPRRTTTPPDPNDTYVVTITRLPLRRHTRIPSVIRATWHIARLLARSDGLIGYSLKADLTAKTFWTVSAWQSTEALNRFVHSEAHVCAMQSIGPHMNQPRIETTTMHGADLPPPWTDIRRRLTDALDPEPVSP
jgi:heme-degrading monooxygenase HmoA